MSAVLSSNCKCLVKIVNFFLSMFLVTICVFNWQNHGEMFTFPCENSPSGASHNTHCSNAMLFLFVSLDSDQYIKTFVYNSSLITDIYTTSN